MSLSYLVLQCDGIRLLILIIIYFQFSFLYRKSNGPSSSSNPSKSDKRKKDRKNQRKNKINIEKAEKLHYAGLPTAEMIEGKKDRKIQGEATAAILYGFENEGMFVLTNDVLACY